MGPTEWTLIAIGVTLLLAVVVLGRTLRTEIASLRTELRSEIADVRTEIAGVRTEVAETHKALSAENGQLRERMAHLEGLLEGLREAITGQRAA